MDTGAGDGRDTPRALPLVLIGLFDAWVVIGLVVAGWWPAVVAVAGLGVAAGAAGWLLCRRGDPLTEG